MSSEAFEVTHRNNENIFDVYL